MMDKTLIVQVSQGVTNFLYRNNLQATEELMRLLDSLSECSLIKAEDYIKVYDDNFFTFVTWEELLKSEEECADMYTIPILISLNHVITEYSRSNFLSYTSAFMTKNTIWYGMGSVFW